MINTPGKLKETFDGWRLKINMFKTEYLTTSLDMDTMFEEINIKIIEESSTLNLSLTRIDPAKDICRRELEMADK